MDLPNPSLEWRYKWGLVKRGAGLLSVGPSNLTNISCMLSFTKETSMLLIKSFITSVSIRLRGLDILFPVVPIVLKVDSLIAGDVKDEIDFNHLYRLRMLAVPGRITKRALNNPDLPVHILGNLVKLDLKNFCIILEYRSIEQRIEISGIDPPQRYELGKVYEFLGMATPQHVLAYWGRSVLPEMWDVTLDQVAFTIDAIESTILLNKNSSEST
jgi:hypothetical protein